MENTIIKHISFISLEKATLSYISLNVSKELAFSICAYAVESGEVTASKVLQLWMSKLGTVYNFEDFGEVDWRHLALCCQNYFEGVTHADEESSNIDGVNCKLCCWLKSSYDFLETVQRKAKKVNLSGLCLFLSFILETAQKCCTFFRLNANSEEWKSQNELVNSVHNLSLNLVWGLLESVEEADDVVYCSIIPSAPLNKLTRKKVEFKWDNFCEIAFEKLRKSLISPKILQYPDFTKEFIVTVDASKIGCGAILSQTHNGNDLPICFASKTFNNSEQKKAIIELELLAIYFAIKQFRPYIYGTHFTVKFDHRPLVYLFNMKDPSSKLSRIRLELSEYNFTIEYIKGKSNVGADALSRISIQELKNSNNQILAVQTRSMTKNHEQLQQAEVTNEENINLQIFDKFSYNFSKKIPRIKSQICHDNDNNKINLKIYAHLKHKKLELLNIACTNKIMQLDELLLKLEKEAGKRNIKQAEWQKDDHLFKYFSISNFKNTGNSILKHLQIILIEPVETVTDNDKKLKLMEIYHNDPISGGHCGNKKLYAKIRTKYYWKNMTRDIIKFVKNCEKCLLNKVKPKTKENLVLTPTPCKPFDVVVIDTIGLLPESNNGNRFAVTIICDLSKYLVTISIPDKTAKTIATAIFEGFILIYGIMKSIKTDLGTEYKNEIFSELSKLLKIEHNFSTACHHETLGTIERNHRVFNEYLRAFLNDNFPEWDVYLKYFTFLHNTTASTVFDNGFTPYELVFGRNFTLPNEVKKEQIDPIYNVENYAKEVKYRLQKTHKLAKNLINKHKIKNKDLYDKRARPLTININDEVIIQKEPRNKHENIYQGPYTVTKIDGVNVTVFDEMNKKEKTVHKNRVNKMLFRVWVNTNSRCFLKNKLGTYEAENRVNLKMRANDKIKVINRICLSSMQNTCLDIKTKVEIWKYAAKFALRYESCSHIGSRNDRTESEWPKSAMNLLIFEIKRNLLVIYNKELNEDVQYVEKYLRVTGFYLKILYEMTTVFQHSNFPVANELFDVLLLTISAPDFIKMSNVFTFVKKHILNGIINILPMMCKNGEFKQMVNDHVGESGSFSFELVMSYLHACIANDDIEFLSSNAESLTRILTRTFQDGELFVDGSSFDEIIDIYATLTHLDSTQSLLRKMQQFVLKGNSALSFACTEVLILVSSLNDRVDEVKSHIEFWNQVDDQFTQFSSNCKRLNVERLIINKNMLCMNQRSNSIHQVQICAISKHSLYNHQTLRRITDRNYCIDHETCNRKIVSNLRYLIERFECNEISVEDHYEIVNAMYKLARCRAVIPKDLQQKIEDFVKKIIDAWTRNHKYAFKRVLSAGFVLIATSANEMQFKILTCIKKCLESGVRFSVMGFWIFLRACCKQQKDLDLYKIAQPIIADTEIPDIIRVSMFENNITQCANNRTVDMQHYSHIESLSKCTTCIKPYFPHRKRLRRENDYEDNDVEDLVQNVCRTLKTILPLSKQLKQSEVEKLTNICRDIKTITDSHHNKS